MATATARKSRTSAEAIPQLTALPERVGVVEAKVEALKEQITDLKADVKEMHDCLDITRDTLVAKLEHMTDEYRDNASKYYEHANHLNEQQSAQHSELAGKIDELEKIKNKWTTYAMVGLAFAAGTGWLNSVQFPHVLKFLGL
jgi:predicted RNase H-like nuclease (RuvC/YqgF family)